GAVETGRVIGCLRVRPLNRPGVGGVGRDGTPVEQVGRYLDDVSPTGQALDLDSVQSVRQQQNGQLRRDRTVGQRHVNIVYKRGIEAGAQIRVFRVAPFQCVDSRRDTELEHAPADFARPSPKPDAIQVELERVPA